MTSPTIVAQYFPQLHAIPENDKWWGKGFTDWWNVKRAKPLYAGHYQPRVPLHHDYYDQSNVDTIRHQAKLAREYGVDAFCHYHYWFDGKRLLNKPTDLLLANKDIDIQFCLAWANETWSRRWDGQDHEILIFQRHPPSVEAWGRHVDALLPYWRDERALRVDGKPMFLIYRPGKIAQLASMLDYFRTRATQAGLPGLHLVTMVQHHFPQWDQLRHFDAAMLFEPFIGALRLHESQPQTPMPLWRTLGGKVLDRMPRIVQEPVKDVTQKSIRPRRHSYDEVWASILAREPDRHLPVYPGAYVDWDNTPRYRKRATVYEGATPERFEYWMSRLVKKVAAGPERPGHIFINAWNEWAESAYLEPDERYGYAYLEALRRAVRGP